MRPQDLSFVPVMADVHPHFFEMLQADRRGDEERLDFTGPRMHKYLRTGLELLAPSIAEDDSMPDYTRRFQPQTGMIVFDVGAHAGLTTIELSQMVGDSGRVYAFEPDREARGYLLENIKRYGASNVTICDTALGERSGEAMFSMDGTQAAGLVDSLVYPTRARVEKVEVATLEDVCDRIGAVPHYLKADIEGGELGMIRGSLDFLREHPIHMAFETHRLRDGSFTHDHLTPLLSSAGYFVEHGAGGATTQSFLYATPA
jgi:FkbM family methyltransferase